MTDIHKIKTLGELKQSGYKVMPVKDELRKNLITKLRKKEEIFKGIIGYENTVKPSIINAVLARHDIILLGLRGQAKTKIARMLTELLDEYIPVVKGSEINDNPLTPVSKYAVDMIKEHGDYTEIEWIGRDNRYGEKLATPDVTIADLIGDIDPIKAATQRLHFSHEGVIHFGIIPRTNRGIFVINELPDLQPRIQVGLLNIMQERDIQIRGFNIRFPLDVFIVFTANPEDYTNRGNIITPLKDRIDSQIMTHYPRTLEDGIRITETQSWTDRGDKQVVIPYFIKEIVEQISREARESEFVEQKSGVSARMSIAVMENLISNCERRAIVNSEDIIYPRITDLTSILPGMTGKIELVFEGEEEGSIKVSRALIGKSVREIFKNYFPDPLIRKRVKQQPDVQPLKDGYEDIIKWFEKGNYVELSDNMKFEDYTRELNKVTGLDKIVKNNIKSVENEHELATMMEFVLDGLHQNSKIAKEETEEGISYRDMINAMLKERPRKSGRQQYDIEEDWNY